MADPVELRFREAAERLIPLRASVLVAVSGGADSVCLLHLLRRCSRDRDLRLSVAHLDHGLRGGSAGDRAFVERLCAELDLPCRGERREVNRLRRAGESPEEAARRVRREFLHDAARAGGADLVATGHHLDDQAETILMRLARGAGPTALAGMEERGPGPFVRPLLALTRAELAAWLARKGLDFRQDPTNACLDADRNRVRHVVLPLLAEALNPRVSRHLVEAARRLREDAAALDTLAARRFGELAHHDASGRLRLDARAVAAEPPAIAGRLARLALDRAGTDTRRVLATHVDALLDLARGASGRRIDLPGGLTAERDRTDVLIRG